MFIRYTGQSGWAYIKWAYIVGLGIIERLCVRQGARDPIQCPPTDCLTLHVPTLLTNSTL